MKKIVSLRAWGLLLAGFIITGCSFNIPKYSASAQNVKSMESLKKKINVGKFTSAKPAESSITCRAAGNVGTPDNSPFDQFIRQAFISELKLADKFDANSPITISGHLENIDFNSNLGTANWVMRLKASSSNTQTVIVNTKHEFDGSFIANQACADVASAFIPAVQKLNTNIVNHPSFYKLLK